MSIGLTSILQRIQGMNTFFRGPNAGRETGVVLEDSATVTWTTDGYGNIQATAAGGSAPTGAENLVYATPNGASGAASLRALVSADLPAGLGGLTLIQNQVLGAPAASVVFSAIPGTYTNLLLVINSTLVGSGTVVIDGSFNGDSAANYTTGYILNAAGAVTGATTPTASSLNMGATGTDGGASQVFIPGYASAISKTVTSTASCAASGTLTQLQGGGIWNETAAITAIGLAPTAGSFATGSTFSLYGMK